jgi:hypothetical protein
MNIVEMTPLDASPDLKHDGAINPYNQDFYHMGTTIGKNVEVMYEHFPTDTHKYIIVINKNSGERVMIEFKE